MNYSVAQPITKRAWQYKQERVKSVQMVRLRNRVTQFLSFILPIVALMLIIFDLLGRSNLFPIEKIEYRSVFKYASQIDIDEVAKLQLNGNFFTIDLAIIQQEIEKLPWVKTVSLDRKWPATIIVNIQEYQPIIRWSGGGWIAKGGDLVGISTDQIVELQNLPKFVGNKAELKTMLYKFRQWQHGLSSMGLQIRELTFSDSHSWSLSLQSIEGIRFLLQLGSVNEDARFNRFVRLYTQDHHYFNAIEYVDARYPNGIVLKRKLSVLEGQVEPDAGV